MAGNYRIELVQEGRAALRKNAVNFLNEHGFEKPDFTVQEKEENQKTLRRLGAKNAGLSTEELIVAYAPNSFDIYGVAHLTSPGTLIRGLLNDKATPPQERLARVDLALGRIYLSKLAVDTEHGGQGIGHALVEKAIEVARDGGYEVICGQIDDEVGDNDKLTKFYRDCGFTVVSPDTEPVQMTGIKNIQTTSPYVGNKFYLEL